MPVTSFTKDLENLTMTVVAEFPVPVRRLWDAYADPRQIEKFWGPPTYPATFTRHDLHPGGITQFHMTGPDGDQHHGHWSYIAVAEGESFEVLDSFADDDGHPLSHEPTMRMTFRFEPQTGGSRLVNTTYFNSLAELERLFEMGMEEGLTSAMTQIDDVVTDLQTFAASRPTEGQILSDTQIRISRIVRGSVQQLWDAHHVEGLITQWMTGPEGWRFTECETATAVGEKYRYAWVDANGENGFAFTGEVLESDPPVREVTSESMEGIESPPSRNELTFTPAEEGTLVTLVITYASKEVRDAVLDSGMVDGMEFGYSRMDEIFAA